MEYYSVVKMNELDLYVSTLIKFQDALFYRKSPTHNVHYVISYVNSLPYT